MPRGESLASPPGLKRTSTCTEHLTAGICESHKVDVGDGLISGNIYGWNMLKLDCLAAKIPLCKFLLHPVECCPLNDIQYSSNQSPWTLKQRSKVSWKQLISAPSCGFEGSQTTWGCLNVAILISQMVCYKMLDFIWFKPFLEPMGPARHPSFPMQLEGISSCRRQSSSACRMCPGSDMDPFMQRPWCGTHCRFERLWNHFMFHDISWDSYRFL